MVIHAEPSVDQLFEQTSNPNGVYVYGDDQWQFDSCVEDSFQELPPEELAFSGLKLYRDVAVMSDGNEYQVHTIMPLRQRSEVPVVLSPAWWTSDGGHNRRTMLRVAELGYPAVMIGTEGSYREPYAQWLGRLVSKPKEVWNGLKQLEMARSAHNIQQILDAHIGNHYYYAEQVIFLGESRGAMVGMGEEAFAAAHGRTPIYADFVAPCFARRLDIKDAAVYPRQLRHELKAIGEAASEATISRLRHYPGTINLSPKSVLHQIATAPTLFSGQAGEMARHIPTDRQMIVSTFAGDIAGQGLEWEKIFSAHKGVVVTRGEGAHMSIANPDTLHSVLGRLSSLLKELEENGDDGRDVDYFKVHLGLVEHIAS